MWRYLILAIGAGSLFVEGQEILLHQEWQPGKRYDFVQKTESTQTSESGSQKIQSSGVVTMHYHVAVKATTGGGRVLLTTIDRTHGRVTLQGRESNFDSEVPALRDPALTKLAGLSFSAHYAANGTLESVTGLDSWAAGVGGKIDVMLFKQLLESASSQSYPDKAVGPGATWQWEQTLETAQLGKWNTKLSFLFESWKERDERPQALVRFTTTIQAGSEKPSGGYVVTLGKDSEQKGFLFHDATRQMVTYQETSTTLRGEITRPGGSPQPFSSDQKITLTLVGYTDVPDEPAASDPAVHSPVSEALDGLR